jgi:signal transduction histidine kinase
MSTRPVHILLVEGDEVDRAAVRRALRRQGTAPGVTIELIEAVDLHAARLVILARELDCALVDYRLPDGTALSLIQELAQQPSRRLPIVILTGLDDEEIAIEALRHGAQDYIRKTELDGQALWRAIRYAIERVRVTELEQRLLHADRLSAIGQLAASVAHEVNNPAGYVLGNLELLDDYLQVPRAAIAAIRELAQRSSDAAMAPAVAAILARHDIDHVLGECRQMISAGLLGIERIRSMVQNLRVFSRVEQGEIEMVALPDVVRAACKLVRAEIRPRASLELRLDPVSEIAADRGQLIQVFTNLLMNAAQAIPPGESPAHRIEVTTRAEDGALRVEIRDTGCGMSPAVRARIFEPFFTTKSREEGTGLGLPLCLDIVRQHRGDIEVQSWEGIGTRVTVILPADTGMAVSAPRWQQPAVELATRRARILIIDDELELLRAYQRLLSPYHDVVVADSGTRGMEILSRDDRFDVIVCDLMMPGVDGVGVYQYLEQERAPLCARLLFWSGGAFTERARTFLARYNPPCLDKPVSRATLLDAVQRIVRSHG